MAAEFDFNNKSVAVIGGTSGINRRIAERFAAAGAKVAVASRSQEKVDDTVAALKDAGAAEAVGFAFDVRDPDAVASAFATLHQSFGDLDILVSGAAGNFPALAADMSVNAFKTVVDIDLMGTVHVMKAAYPYLRRPGASIISISAPQSYLPYEGQAHVCAAKAGVDQITRTLSMEWGGEGIRINSVVPGFIDGTEGARRLSPTPEVLKGVTRSIPLGRLGDCDDVANACLFLSSEQASYISGTVLAVDGALYQRGSGSIGEMMGHMLRQPSAQKKG